MIAARTLFLSQLARWFFFLAAAPFFIVFFLAEDSFAGTVNKTSRFELAVVDGMQKFAEDEFPRDGGAPAIELAGARNEYESAQIIMRSTADVNGVTLQVTPLTGEGGTIPLSDIRLYLLHYMALKDASDSFGRAARWPDALVPLQQAFALRGGRSQALWLKIYIAPNVRAGVYRGKLTITAGADIVVLNVSCEVWDVTLPQQQNIPLAFGLDYESIEKFEGPAPLEKFERTILPAYYAVLREHRASPTFLFNVLPDYSETGSQINVDFSPFWRKLNEAYGGLPPGPIAIPFSESWPVDSKRYPLFSAEYNRRVSVYLKEAARFLAQHNFLDRAYLYIPGTDEPHTSAHYDLIRRFAELIRSADPRLRMLQTLHAECADCKTDVTALDHDVTLWVPNIATFDNSSMRVKSSLFGLGTPDVSGVPSGWTPTFKQHLRQRNAQVWWYLNSWTFLLPGTQPRYPSLFIDRPGSEVRMLGWLAYKYGVSGIAHWDATYWRYVNNPWATVPRGEEGAGIAGDGVLLYPARGSSRYTGQPDPAAPIASLRLELLRDAAEDYELLNLARARGKTQAASRAVDSVAVSLTQFAATPQPIRTARRLLATELAGSDGRR